MSGLGNRNTDNKESVVVRIFLTNGVNSHKLCEFFSHLKKDFSESGKNCLRWKGGFTQGQKKRKRGDI